MFYRLTFFQEKHPQNIFLTGVLGVNRPNFRTNIVHSSLFAELERDMISLRTKEALQVKRAQGVKLGKPKGTLQKSKFDKDIDKIKELLGYELSARKIAKVLGYSSHIALNTHIIKRELRSKQEKTLL